MHECSSSTSIIWKVPLLLKHESPQVDSWDLDIFVRGFSWHLSEFSTNFTRVIDRAFGRLAVICPDVTVRRAFQVPVYPVLYQYMLLLYEYCTVSNTLCNVVNRVERILVDRGCRCAQQGTRELKSPRLNAPFTSQWQPAMTYYTSCRGVMVSCVYYDCHREVNRPC